MKRFFETPKKAVISVFCIIALIAVIGTGTVYAANVIAKNSSIGEEKARNFAFEDAGVDPSSAKTVHTEFDFEQGQFVYEVEFTADGVEYEYVVKAFDGSIINKEIEADNRQNKSNEKKNTDAPQAESQPQQDINDAQQNINQSQQNMDQSQNNNDQISLETAKAAALADAGADVSAVTFTKAKQDYEDGVLVYEIEFYTAETEYEYEINAATGEICSKDIENRQKRHETEINQNAASIGTEQAKSIAVSHAGFSVEDVIFKEVKLEQDDGLTEYEIEFYKENTKYEYKINAANGTILEFDVEQGR